MLLIIILDGSFYNVSPPFSHLALLYISYLVSHVVSLLVSHVVSLFVSHVVSLFVSHEKNWFKKNGQPKQRQTQWNEGREAPCHHEPFSKKFPVKKPWKKVRQFARTTQEGRLQLFANAFPTL